eukprot:3907813-Amphidinium_carterae.1
MQAAGASSDDVKQDRISLVSYYTASSCNLSGPLRPSSGNLAIRTPALAGLATWQSELGRLWMGICDSRWTCWARHRWQSFLMRVTIDPIAPRDSVFDIYWLSLWQQKTAFVCPESAGSAPSVKQFASTVCTHWSS